MNARSTYYYAGRERVPLELDGDYVAINMGHAKARGLDPEFVASIRPHMSVLPGGGLVVVPTAVVPETIRAGLEKAGTLQPVYRSGAARMVPYPEVRVHVEPGEKRKLLSTVKASKIPADVSPEDHGDIVLRPRSGSGEDALALANFVYEKTRPEMAQARFVRIVPRPDAQPRVR